MLSALNPKKEKKDKNTKLPPKLPAALRRQQPQLADFILWLTDEDAEKRPNVDQAPFPLLFPLLLQSGPPRLSLA